MLTSFLISILCVFYIEFSFWSLYGDYIWHITFLLVPLAMLVEACVETLVKELLLIVPITSALGLTEGIITFGASDFLDFLFGHFIGYGIGVVQFVYIDPSLGGLIASFVGIVLTVKSWFTVRAKRFARRYRWLFNWRRRLNPRSGMTEEQKKNLIAQEKRKLEAEALAAKRLAAKAEADAKAAAEEEGGAQNETVEPILDSFTSYSGGTLSLFYQPFLIGSVFMFFRAEVGLPDAYGIREQDMEYYLWFSIIILFFIVVADMFMQNVQQLFHGWKMYDYLVYTRYRFLQRELRWKGFEDSLDECIDESMRTLDQMCFSSQYYMMNSLHISGMLFVTLAIEIILRSEYNAFGDPAVPIVLIYVLSSAWFLKKLFIFVGARVDLWKVKHENTAWHGAQTEDDDEELNIPGWEDVKGASRDAFIMNQRITAESFRYKFLNYNRAWLIEQLPSILTPRTLQRARPYLVTQLSRVLDSLNPNISDISDEDDDGRPKFGPVALTSAQRQIIRTWLAQARRRRRLFEVVQPIINQARGNECEQCLSRRQLQVELVIPIEVLADRFERETGAQEFDQVAWKMYFKKNEKFRTLCLECISKRLEEDKAKAQLVFDIGSEEDDERFGPVFLSSSSRAIMMLWYRNAQARIFGPGGRCVYFC